VTGTYDVLIRPPDSLKLPYLWQRNIEVSGLEDSFTLPSQLVAPFELFGQILDESSGQPVQATIEAFALAEDNTAIRIGRGSSNASGQYRIVLPASQPETTLRRPAAVP
jgi:hypothetical protein